MENLENNSFDLDSENEEFEVNENKKSFSFLNNSPIIKNLILASITLPLLFFLYLKFLDIYTLHDRYITVPDYSGFNLNQLDSISEANNLRYVIIDSISDILKMTFARFLRLKNECLQLWQATRPHNLFGCCCYLEIFGMGFEIHFRHF